MGCNVRASEAYIHHHYFAFPMADDERFTFPLCFLIFCLLTYSWGKCTTKMTIFLSEKVWAHLAPKLFFGLSLLILFWTCFDWFARLVERGSILFSRSLPSVVLTLDFDPGSRCGYRVVYSPTIRAYIDLIAGIHCTHYFLPVMALLDVSLFSILNINILSRWFNHHILHGYLTIYYLGSII